MSDLLSSARTISVVGNGPVPTAAAREIDDADLVVRMNHARLCGAAGKRTDILVVNERIRNHGFGGSGQPINPLAIKGAREIWLTYSPVAQKEHEGRPLVFIDQYPQIDQLCRELELHAKPGERVIASVGARAVRYILKNSSADIVLYGFTHQGDRMHNWSAEAKWMGELVKGGRVRYCATGGATVRETTGMSLRRYARRIANHIRSGRF